MHSAAPSRQSAYARIPRPLRAVLALVVAAVSLAGIIVDVGEVYAWSVFAIAAGELLHALVRTDDDADGRGGDAGPDDAHAAGPAVAAPAGPDTGVRGNLM